MLKPAMNKHFFSILLLLLCLLVSGPAEARLTLGIVPGTQDSSGEVPLGQANALAERLTEKLQEEVVVKELADTATLINWIDRFAMLDLALLSSRDVEANPGRFLSVGKMHPESDLLLVSRQGINGDWLQQAAEILRTSTLPTEKVEKTVAQGKVSLQEDVPTPGREKPILPVKQDLSAQQGLEHVPPLTPGRAWTPQEELVGREFIPSDEPELTKLVLGVVPSPGGLFRTTGQAQQLVRYLEQTLPVSVTIREFARMEAFTEWFMRYKMVDLAILSPGLAETKLGRDYLPIVKFMRSDKPGEDSAELFVMRRGQNPELLAMLQSSLMKVGQVSEGQDLMQALNLSEVLSPGETVSLPALVEERPEPVPEPPFEPVALPEEVSEKLAEEPAPVTPEYAQPLEPVAPLPVVAKPLPDVPKAVSPPVAPLLPALTDKTPDVPAQKVMPDKPAEPVLVSEIKLPEVSVPVSEPSEPPVPKQPPAVAEVAPPEIAASVKAPVAPETPAVPEAPVAEEPVVVEKLRAEPVPVAFELEASPPAESPSLSTGEVFAPVSDEPVEDSPLLSSTDAETPEVAEPPGETAVETVEAPAVSDEQVPMEETLAGDIVVLEPEPMIGHGTLPDTVTVEEQRQFEEAMLYAKLTPEENSSEPSSADAELSPEDALNAEILALLGEDAVASVVAQPDIPQGFRPSGVPVVRAPRKATRSVTEDDTLIVASMPEPLKQTVPDQPPQLLPQPLPEPGVVYVVPFVAIMVPSEVNDRLFDEFVDQLNQGGEAFGVQFVILKEGLQRVDPGWLEIRKYVTGEIYAYVEDSSCCSTELRTRARLTYHRPGQGAPIFSYEYPVKAFFDHDNSTIDVERAKVAEEIAAKLSSELLTVLRN
jgi:hypothetical protein